MNARAAEYRDGAIWWRGSGSTWTYFPIDQAVRLRDIFAAEPIVLDGIDWAARYAADLTAAIEAHEADQPPMEEGIAA